MLELGNLRYNAHLMLSWAKLGPKWFVCNRAGCPANATSLSHGRRNTSMCSAPLMKAPLEPSLASHSIREVRLCKREVLGWELRERWNATRDSSYLHNMQVRTAPSPSLVSVPVALIYVYSAFLAIK